MVIIQLLKDTKYPANYQIIIDSSLGNFVVLRDFFSALKKDGEAIDVTFTFPVEFRIKK